ncbi:MULTISPECIES: 3-hydroxy-9,10-secoandrosta-1,3,5(10)-triene-9,17-dione monooxygenase oxygenase subunit [unclassified Nocardioides]|uniref:3-hydroxy-9,10-secoandrosta-1,3,5(10)-triene-9, 17-dione monooxygenase oxygenase subunit n=1 Tax=unclassified Nocardioides TaxID=2615069 RepID=UPI0006F1CED4|nr:MULTISPECIES: 3-hydroxy-9,10-secoandrosta-1,3,5(10)-triene-9,17-dione monooxygenase oxygenase subunit [unclassified Nocardioides]KQY50961.1 monooxygenase [Nocardioides sp. Root140]KQZ75542.1 monooxygenase [Nocardioides sp. Root151]KRF14617.1 monooxygenase [Nocardioides sp. Soil796]
MSQDVLDNVRALLPAIAERAVSTDEARVVSKETIAELTDTGLFRMLQPKKYGGLELEPLRFYEAVRMISGACGSTGWVSSVMGVHPWQVALFAKAAQDEVWSDGPDVLLASSYAPVGQLKRASGGYRMSGRWSFSSGCNHAEWLLLGALVIGPTGNPVDFITALVPRADVEILDVWNTVGLRGTGSNDVVVEDVFVPEHRTLRNFEHARLTGPGQKVNKGPLYRMPFGAIFTTAVTAPVLGAVAGCLETYVGEMADRLRLSLGGGRFAEDQFAQVAVARASSAVDGAVLQMDRNMSEMYAAAAAGGEIPMELRLRTRRDQVLGTERALEAIDILFKTAGGSSLHWTSAISRAWRDAHAGSVHVANDVERTLALYGKGVFGITVEDNLI